MSAVHGRPVRVAFLAGQLGAGGSERQLQMLLPRLDPGTFHCSVLVFHRTDGYAYDAQLESAGVRVVHLREGRLGALGRALELFSWLRRERPEIVHSWMFHSNAYAGVLGALAGVPVRLGSLRGLYSASLVQDMPALWRWLCRRSVQRIVANSRVALVELKRAGLPDSRLTLLPNCLAPSVADGTSPVPDLSTYGIEPRHRVVGTVGNLRKVKNHGMFVDAVSEVIRRNPEVRGLIVGQADGSEPEVADDVRRRIQAGAGAGRIALAGFRDDVPRLLRRFDVFCLTSTSEGTPNAIIEAMAAGRPVVATAVGGVPELVQDGVTGLLVRSGESSAMAEAISRLLDDPPLASRLGEAGRRRFEGAFGVEAAASTLTALYASALERHRGA